MSVFSRLYERFRNLILYGIIGSFTASLDFTVFWLLSHYTGLQYLIANIIGVTVGITTSFILNRKYNFKVEDHTARRFVIFLSVGLFGMLVSSGILYYCVDVMQLNKIPSKLLSIVIVVLAQFFLNKYITFKITRHE